MEFPGFASALTKAMKNVGVSLHGTEVTLATKELLAYVNSVVDPKPEPVLVAGEAKASPLPKAVLEAQKNK